MRVALDIREIAPGGEGLGRAGERSIYVPFSAPGDRVEVEAPAGEGPAHATLLRVLGQGRARVAPPCRHFGPPLAGETGCGGCEWLHLSYPVQLSAKERSFAETLRRIGRIDPAAAPLRPILPSPRPLRYRSRAKFHYDRSSARLAFYRRRSHEAVALRECHLLEPALDSLREAVGPALAEARLAPRQVALEWSPHLGRGAAWLQVTEVGPSARRRAEALLAALPALQGVVLTSPHGGRSPRGPAAPAVLVGDPVLRQERVPGDPAAGLARSRPDVFQQANRPANALLVQAALDLLRPDGEEVLELFCGAGNFTGPLAARARSVSAVEVQGPALELARLDLSSGGGPSSPRREVRFFAGDALALARAFARETGSGSPRFGAVLLDPPRDGAKGVGPALRDLGVPRAVYVSCDPATFARDLRSCVEAGYRLEAIQPVDMFPQTHHVEGVALVVR